MSSHSRSRSRSRSPVERPNFTPSGFLSRLDAKREPYKSAYAAPRDREVPDETWSLFVYKGAEELEHIMLAGRDHFIVGRGERCHVATLHPSCSKEHAVVQFRRKDGLVRPYVLDLETTNGTSVNGHRLQPSRFYELRSEDMLKFAHSSRDYVLVRAPQA